MQRSRPQSATLDSGPPGDGIGPVGRLGRNTATHFRVALVGWLIVAIGLGFFTPRVESPFRRGLGDDGLSVGAGAPPDQHGLPRPVELTRELSSVLRRRGR